MAEGPENKDILHPEEDGAEGGQGNERLKDLQILQQEVEKRIRDNQRFLERFMDDDFDEEEDSEEGDGIFEEL